MKRTQLCTDWLPSCMFCSFVRARKLNIFSQIKDPLLTQFVRLMSLNTQALKERYQIQPQFTPLDLTLCKSINQFRTHPHDTRTNFISRARFRLLAMTDARSCLIRPVSLLSLSMNVVAGRPLGRLSCLFPKEVVEKQSHSCFSNSGHWTAASVSGDL